MRARYLCIKGGVFCDLVDGKGHRTYNIKDKEITIEVR